MSSPTAHLTHSTGRTPSNKQSPRIEKISKSPTSTTEMETSPSQYPPDDDYDSSDDTGTDTTAETELALREAISSPNQTTRFTPPPPPPQRPPNRGKSTPEPLQRVERHVGDGTTEYYYEEDDYATLDREEEIVEDATTSVHETHYALLYLMSNPEEFHACLSREYGSMREWNDASDEEEEKQRGGDPPLPYAVFAGDAEVVLPQAHTASQLFGVETVRGVELEAAAGVPALSQLFLRWLALMPGGDHCNIIDPPGLTVMRIAGGRYRVTAAHRVVWTWLNDFLPEAIPSFGLTNGSPHSKEELRFAFGDLVTMTIVDVFETDKDGKLLSYCPTFDNRSVAKTNQTKERIFKESTKVKKGIDYLAKSQAAAQVNRAASFLGRIGMRAAVKCKYSVEERIKEHYKKSQEVEQNAPQKVIQSPLHPNFKGDAKDAEAFQRAVSAAEVATEEKRENRNEHYVSDDETSAPERR